MYYKCTMYLFSQMKTTHVTSIQHPETESDGPSRALGPPAHSINSSGTH